VAADLLLSPSPQAHISAILRAERNLSLALVGSVRSLRHSLHLGLRDLPVPPEVQVAAADAGSSEAVTPASVDKATTVLNEMLRDAHWELDKKIVECHVLPKRYQSAAQQATAAVQQLASEISYHRATVAGASTGTPENDAWFLSLKAALRFGRQDCENDQLKYRSKVRALRKDAKAIVKLQALLNAQCNLNLSLLVSGKECGGVIRRKARSWMQRVKKSLRGIASAHVRRRLRPLMFQRGAWAANESQHRRLEESPRHSGPQRRLLLRDGGSHQPLLGGCHVDRQACEGMADMLSEIAGEISDALRQVEAEAASSRRACSEDSFFENSEMLHASRRERDLSQELAEATAKLSVLTKAEEQKEAERRDLERKLRLSLAHCAREVHELLHDRICGLQRMRDHLWLLLGRTKLPEDCEVTEWEEGECSRSCGGGTQVSTREVIQPAWKGMQCPPLKMVQPCQEAACPMSCVVSIWSGWSQCSAECDGGMQERTRGVITEARGGGDSCPELVNTRLCNSRACSQDCPLAAWSAWSSCSRACGSGTQRRLRALGPGTSRDGNCPSQDSKERLELRSCNRHFCSDVENLTCAGVPLDVVLLVDASGSVTEAGFSSLRDLTLELVRRYAPRAGGSQVSVVAFAQEAQLISGLVDDTGTLQNRIGSRLKWQRGASLLSPGLAAAADVLLARGRRNSVSTVLVLTDGRIADPFLARQSAVRLRRRGARLVFAQVGQGDKKNLLLERLVSEPPRENLIAVQSMDQLSYHIKAAARHIIVNTCSAVLDH